MILIPSTNLRFHFDEAEARFYIDISLTINDVKIEDDSLQVESTIIFEVNVIRGNHSCTHGVLGVPGKIFNPECLAKHMKLGIAEARRRNKEEKEQKSVTCFRCYYVGTYFLLSMHNT